jgi:glycosyltransferase involved in cell wall biosynthesis
MAEILVSPRTEGLSVPLKIYSYLYSGKPTVATSIFAHTQLLNEEVSVLVPPDKDEFAEGILRLIQDPGLREQIGRHARALAQEKYSPANYLAKLDQIYQTLQPPEHASGQPNSSPKELIGS